MNRKTAREKQYSQAAGRCTWAFKPRERTIAAGAVGQL